MVAGSIHTKRVIKREFVINIKPEREMRQERDREKGNKKGIEREVTRKG